MSSIFPNAIEARKKALNLELIYTEIRDIELKILTAISTSSYSVIISDTTLTTGILAEDYFKVWNGTVSNIVFSDHINTIQKHFIDLNYDFKIITNSTTNNTFSWSISW